MDAVANSNSNLEQYRKSAVNGASPLQLVIMLYDGAFKFMAAGKRAMLQSNIAEQNKNLQRAEKIIAELIACLDLQKGGEVAANLLALYTFCYNRLVESNVEDKPEYIDQACEVLTNLRAGWVELEQNLRLNGGAQYDAA